MIPRQEGYKGRQYGRNRLAGTAPEAGQEDAHNNYGSIYKG